MSLKGGAGGYYAVRAAGIVFDFTNPNEGAENVWDMDEDSLPALEKGRKVAKEHKVAGVTDSSCPMLPASGLSR